MLRSALHDSGWGYGRSYPLWVQGCALEPCLGDAPLLELGVGDAEVVRDLVRDRLAHLLHDLLRLTPGDIGRSLGGRDRTTVLYGIKRISTRLVIDSDLSQALASLRASLASTSTPSST